MAGGNRETVGAITIAAGTLFLIGAVRGTWQRIFRDVILDEPSKTPSGAPTGPQQSGPAPGAGPLSAGVVTPGEIVASPPSVTMDAAIPTSPQSGPLLAAAGAISPPPGVAGTVWRQAGS